MREFFIKNEQKDKNWALYEYSVNIDNPLSFNGDFAESFAEAMESIWEFGRQMLIFLSGLESSKNN